MHRSTRSRASEATAGRPLSKKAKTEPDHQQDTEAEDEDPQQETTKPVQVGPTWGVPQPEWDALLRKHSFTRVSMDFYDLYTLAAYLSPSKPLGANEARWLLADWSRLLV